jgi:hypothetical protein
MNIPRFEKAGLIQIQKAKGFNTIRPFVSI